MSVVSFEITKDLAASPPEVWSVLADYSRDREWRAGVEMRQEPPGLAAPGALTYERLQFLGSEKQVVARVEEVEAGRRLTFRTLQSDVPVWGERCVEPHGEHGSRVTVRLRMMPKGAWAWFARPLAFLFRRRFERDLERLAALLGRERSLGSYSAAATL